jgi:uncharacterized OsmC-like protein
MKIELDWTGNIGFTAKTRQFTGLAIDEPEEFHGDDRGPSSVEYLGIAIGGCLGTSFSYCLKKMEVPIKTMRISIDVNLHHVDMDGVNPLRVTGIAAEINVVLENDEDSELLDLCIESYKKYCVVTQSVIAGIPVDVQITKA